METASTSFPYQPLNEAKGDIRLILLYSSRDLTSPIRCNLVTVSLKQNPQYEALSYTWGSSDFHELITLDNNDFGVTENLKLALLALRKPDYSRYLWVDSICINQEDTTEKGREVPRILQIYTGASRVLVWLGLASNDSGLAMDHLEELARDFDRRASMGVFRLLAQAIFDLAVVMLFFVFALFKLVFSDKRTFLWVPMVCIDLIYWPSKVLGFLARSSVLVIFLQSFFRAWARTASWNNGRDRHCSAMMNPGEEVISAIARMFNRPWFSRSWTVQELVGAKKAILICGNRTLSWLQFARAYRTIEYRVQMAGTSEDSPYKRAQSQHVHAFLDALDIEYLPPSNQEFRRSLLRLMVTFSDRDASLNRDKVYAFLGMSNEGRQMNIEKVNYSPRLVPDYRRRGNNPNGEFMKSDSEIFVDLAKFLIESTKTLDVVHACFFRSTQSNYPSWVPDWSTHKQDGRLQTSPFVYAACPSPFRAPYRLSTSTISHEGQPVARFPLHTEYNCIMVEGFMIGRLVQERMVVDFGDPFAFLRENVPSQAFELMGVAARILSFFVACIFFTIEVISQNPLSRRLFAYVARRDPAGLGPTFSTLSEAPTSVPPSRNRPTTGFGETRRAIKLSNDIRPPPAHGWEFKPTDEFRDIIPSHIFSTYTPEAQAGDLVVMLVGAKMPMIIRYRVHESISVQDNVVPIFRYVGPGTFVHAIDRRAWAKIREAHSEDRCHLEEFTIV